MPAIVSILNIGISNASRMAVMKANRDKWAQIAYERLMREADTGTVGGEVSSITSAAAS